MYLIDLILEKDRLDKKIKELEFILHTESTDAITQELLDSIEARQNKLISIHIINNKSSIKIGNEIVDINTAVILRNIINKKIEILTNLINDPNCNLDKIALMNQRDQFNDKYVLLKIGILRNDLNVEIG